jgi:hypothetical protein
MLRDDSDFGERILRDLRSRRAACRILDVGENAGADELKRAYRRTSVKCHPDHNPGDKGARRKFLLAKCAYELLAHDVPCDLLTEQVEIDRAAPSDSRYRLDNAWGCFLWWREKFFDGPF